MATSIPVPAPTNTIIVAAGSNLFALAAQYLGDATKWNQIADLNPACNGDPMITQTLTLVLPSTVIATNGGLIGR